MQLSIDNNIMAQNKNFIAARLPQELYDRLESTAGNKKGEKTQIIIRAIAAYLEFPLNSTDTTADNSERFLTLENRIAELEEQFQKFKALVISSNLTDNINKTLVITTDNTTSSNDNSTQAGINTDNRHDNKSTVPVQNDGSIGPAPESQIADSMKINRRTLAYHRKTLKEAGKPPNQPKRVKYNNKLYDLICLGETKHRGKPTFLWVANPVIETDNKIYQSDIIDYQADNNLLDTLQEPNQEEQKQDSESSELNNNSGYQQLSENPDINQDDQQDSQSSQVIDNNGYQQLSVEPDGIQQEDEQDLQSLEHPDNVSYQELSAQPDFNEELNEEQQDSGEQSTPEHQPELPGEEQPEF